MTLNELKDQIFAWAKEKGWWDQSHDLSGSPPNFPEKLALVHSEISEALEEYRIVGPAKICDTRICQNIETGRDKPEGVPIELADAIIRILDMCGYWNIDIEEAVRVKMEYNAKRPFRHGGKVC